MRKLFGISLFAILAVVPVMANADEGDRDANLNKFEIGAIVHSPVMASVSYVNGAFKAAADKIDLLIDDTAVETDGDYIGEGKSVSANLKALDGGLGDVNDVVSAHTTTLTTLTGSGDGSISKQIATALNGVSGNAGDLAQLTTEDKDSLVDAVNEVNAVATDNAEAISAINKKKISYVDDWSNPTVKTQEISELD